MAFKRREKIQLSHNFGLMLEILKILTASSCEISHLTHTIGRLWIRQYKCHYSLKLTHRKYHIEYLFRLLMLHFSCRWHCASCMSLYLQRDLQTIFNAKKHIRIWINIVFSVSINFNRLCLFSCYWKHWKTHRNKIVLGDGTQCIIQQAME